MPSVGSVAICKHRKWFASRRITTAGWPPSERQQWESDVNFAASRTLASTSCASGLFLALALTIGTARAQDKTYVMKITTPTLNASPDTYARNYAAAIEQESRGRIKAEVYAGRPSAFCSCERSSGQQQGRSDRNPCCSCHAVTPSRFALPD
jgi:hypothetical protein